MTSSRCFRLVAVMLLKKRQTCDCKLAQRPTCAATLASLRFRDARASFHHKIAPNPAHITLALAVSKEAATAVALDIP